MWNLKHSFSLYFRLFSNFVYLRRVAVIVFGLVGLSVSWRLPMAAVSESHGKQSRHDDKQFVIDALSVDILIHENYYYVHLHLRQFINIFQFYTSIGCRKFDGMMHNKECDAPMYLKQKKNLNKQQRNLPNDDQNFIDWYWQTKREPENECSL